MLSITVLTYNAKPGLLEGCIESINKQEITFQHEKVIVDNGSDVPLNPDSFPGWRIVRIETNRGISGGINACFENAKYEKVLFVANDVRFCGVGAIEGLWKISCTTMTAPVLLERGKTWRGMNLHYPMYGVQSENWGDIVPNTCFLFSKSRWREVGGFDENIKFGYDDIDFYLRAQYVAIFSPVRVEHLCNQTLGTQFKNHRKEYHRSRQYVIKKHYKGVDKLTRLLLELLIYGITTVIRPGK